MADATTVLASGLDCHLQSGCGFPAPGTDIFQFEPVLEYSIFGLHFVINKPVLLMILGSVLIIVFFAFAFGKPRLVPGKVQSIGEVTYTFIRNDIGRETIGKDGDRFMPFLMSLFVFVAVMNMFGIIPLAQFPVTSVFAFTVTLAAMVWLTYMFLGFKHQGGAFIKNMCVPKGVPIWVLCILAPIEFLSNIFIRPFTLAIRLFANMFAGHLLLTVFIVATFYLISPSVIGILGATASFLMTIIMTAFEFAIEILQAYIFTLLTASYIAGSLHAEH